jgi:ATP-binding cassette subfamily B (MDR/TAP) protein 1
LANLYDEHIVQSENQDLKAAVWHGGGLAVFFFIIYNSYALGGKNTSTYCTLLTRSLV